MTRLSSSAWPMRPWVRRLGRTLDVCACEVFHRKGTNCIFTRPSAVIGMGAGASPGSRTSSLADKDGQSGPPADDAHMADQCEGVPGFTVFPDIAEGYQTLQRMPSPQIAASFRPTKPTRVIPAKGRDPAVGT